jgi:hypothetical protein
MRGGVVAGRTHGVGWPACCGAASQDNAGSDEARGTGVENVARVRPTTPGAGTCMRECASLSGSGQLVIPAKAHCCPGKFEQCLVGVDPRGCVPSSACGGRCRLRRQDAEANGEAGPKGGPQESGP